VRGPSRAKALPHHRARCSVDRVNAARPADGALIDFAIGGEPESHRHVESLAPDRDAVRHVHRSHIHVRWRILCRGRSGAQRAGAERQRQSCSQAAVSPFFSA
jgi:hypothetical protein